jgi:predicted nucleic acid-binding protein
LTRSNLAVVDASIGVKWFVDEEEDDLARALFADSVRAGIQLVTPPHFEFEVVNGVWRKVRRGQLNPALAREAISSFSEYRITVLHPDSLAEDAYELELRIRSGAIYDLLYVALAQILGCVLWTADARLVNALTNVPVFVRLLSTYARDPA